MIIFGIALYKRRYYYMMKLVIALFNQSNCDKDYLLNNKILRFNAFGSYLEIKCHFEIWDCNFATKAFLHLWSIIFHLNTIADLNHTHTHKQTNKTKQNKTKQKTKQTNKTKQHKRKPRHLKIIHIAPELYNKCRHRR